jgi:hypothetical protein
MTVKIQNNNNPLPLADVFRKACMISCNGPSSQSFAARCIYDMVFYDIRNCILMHYDVEDVKKTQL